MTEDSEILPPLCDSLGRPYAKLSDLTSGSKITLDSGFTCHEAGPAIVSSLDSATASTNLYFHCSCKAAGYKHMLDGQLDGDEDYLIGIYHYDKDLDGPTPRSWPKENQE